MDLMGITSMLNAELLEVDYFVTELICLDLFVRGRQV